ncbi:MAG: 16S rRNA (guanine(966)-N(2))-methyltransferase RsmD [Oscillospiraceae bacterium]
MRIITGTARGRKLLTLEGVDVRPTTERVKEAIFSAIQFEIEDRRVLDLFAGSGQLGIEALSRGARCATFIDQSRKSIEIIEENLKSTNLDKNTIVKNTNAVDFLSMTKDTFDIAFLDPPYHNDLITKCLPLLCEKMSQGGVVICETQADEELPDNVGNFKIFREYKHGKIKMTIYRSNEVSE